MDRLIAVGFRIGHVVVKLTWQVTIFGVHHAQRRITILQFVGDDANRAHVEQFVKREVFLLHLAPDAVDMFRTAAHFRVDAGDAHLVTQIVDEITNVLLAHNAALRELLGDLFVGIRLLITESVIFDFPFELTNAQAVCQRRVDVGTLFRGRAADLIWLIFHFTQVTDAFSQLDDHAAEIIHHREQHAAHVIDLRRGFTALDRDIQLADGGHLFHAVDQLNDLFAVMFFQLFTIQ